MTPFEYHGGSWVQSNEPGAVRRGQRGAFCFQATYNTEPQAFLSCFLEKHSHNKNFASKFQEGPNNPSTLQGSFAKTPQNTMTLGHKEEELEK